MKTGKWPLALAAPAVTVLGALACLIAGRTAAHALTIALAAAYLFWTAFLTDRYLPSQQSARVRLASAGIFAGGWLALMAFYLWHGLAARYVFINDDALYYYQQLTLSAKLGEGLLPTLRFVYDSFSADYTYVPNLFMAPLFSMTDRSIAGFGMAAAVMAWTPMMYQLRRVTLRLADRLELPTAGTLLLCVGTCLSVLALPLLHRAAAWRQINLLGLPVLLQVVVLSWDADFRRWEPLRLVMLLASVLTLTLMRRWFVFFLAGYLPLWGIVTLVRLCRGREWRAVLRLGLYGAGCAAVGLALLWPFVTHALQGNYAVTYAYWKRDGLPYELWNQSWLLGWGSCVLIGAGYGWALLQRRSHPVRLLAAVMLAGAAIALVLFTSIQNMTFHQATILMPAYVLGLMLFFAMLACCRVRWLRIGTAVLAGAALLLQWGVSVTTDRPQDVSPLLSHVSLRPPVRDDFASLQEVAALVDADCGPTAPALFLCNNAAYDRLTFVALRYPDLSMRQKVSLDRIALPSDGFPRAWFAARYIIVPTQAMTNQPGGTVEKLTRHALADEADRFEVVRTVDFGGFDMLILQRKGPVQWDEAEELTALFAEESDAYPALYRDRIRWFCEQAIYNPELRFN